MAAESAQRKALQRCYAVILDTLQSPDGIAARLFSREKLTPNELEAIQSEQLRASKCQKLMNTLVRRVALEPSELDVFMAILREEPANNAIVGRLEGALQEARLEMGERSDC